MANYDSGNLQEALADFTLAIRTLPSFASAYFMRGRVYQALGNQQGAYRDYNLAEVLWPICVGPCGAGGSLKASNPEAFYERGRILARQGNKQEAIKALGSWIK